MTREKRIEAFRAKTAMPRALPLLSEGAGYMMELCASETVVPVVLLRIIDDGPLGRGFSFQLSNKRLFVYERDIRPGPDGLLIVTGSG